MKNNLFKLAYLILLSMPLIFSTTIFASNLYKNNYFSVLLPKNIPFKQDTNLSKGKKCWLFEGEAATFVIICTEDLSNVPVSQLDFKNPHVRINSERASIAFLNADVLKHKLDTYVSAQNFMDVHKNSKTITIKLNFFENYEVKLPEVSVSYFATEFNRRLFTIAIGGRHSTKFAFTNKSIMALMNSFSIVNKGVIMTPLSRR